MEHDRFVLAGDVGGTNLRIAAVDPAGTVLHISQSKTPASAGSDDVIRAILDGAASCIAHAPGNRPHSFCLALPALVNSNSGTVLISPNLPQLNGVQLGERIEAELGIATVLENDATAAAVGEHWLGSTKSAKNSVFVTLGTGIGGGLILDGKPYRGIDGTAGEIGHICVVPDGHPCGCGSRGCVEQYASARAVARIASEVAVNSLTPRPYSTSKDVFDAAIGGDPVAVEAFRIMGRHLGLALAALVNVLNPELIAIGGGAAHAWDLFAEHVRACIDAHAFGPPAQRVGIVRAAIGESAGILGAAKVALDHPAN